MTVAEGLLRKGKRTKERRRTGKMALGGMDMIKVCYMHI
jgi:hypothetical protein